MQKLPIGIQTFSKIIEGDYLYVDKTEMALNLVENNQHVFLSRPRRFGKSLFVSTLQELFEGNRELFKDLYAYNNWNWDEKYPVIKIEFGGIKSVQELKESISLSIINHLKKFDIELDSKLDYAFKFSELIKELKNKYNQKVVILIDEYDKPILDNLDNIDVAIEIREILKRFYTQIKVNDQYLKFVFLTGVSKFSKVSLFSGLNNLNDISLNKNYGTICGYTHNDIETKFLPYLDGVDMEKLKEWYNGYNFFGNKVYNPFDILLFIDKDKEYNNYWFETGTPSFLLKLIKSNNYFIPGLDNLDVEESFINSFDIEELNLETIMFQTGYLTVKRSFREFDSTFYELTFPNKEVRQSFYSYVLNLFVSSSDKTHLRRGAVKALQYSNLDELKSCLESLFAGIPYNNFTKNSISNFEGFYASVIYTYFSTLGIRTIPEDVTNKGRIDLTLKLENKTYIFEFKVTDESPLDQIKKKRYYEKYSGKVFIVGIVFDPKERNITKLEWERV